MRATALAVCVTIAACSSNPNGPSDARTFAFDFASGPLGFVAGFADYPPADASTYFLTADYRSLPEPLDTSRQALFISGVNRSDDLFMFYKGRVNGLRPNEQYRATFEIEFATSAPSGCVGVGGAPGESVWVKAGASGVEPVPFIDAGYLRMNIDKGNQSNGGADALVLGNVASSVACGDEPAWELKRLFSGPEAIVVEADQAGRVWLLFASDSGFESLTGLYYTQVAVTFDPVGGPTELGP